MGLNGLLHSAADFHHEAQTSTNTSRASVHATGVSGTH